MSTATRNGKAKGNAIPKGGVPLNRLGKPNKSWCIREVMNSGVSLTSDEIIAMVRSGFGVEVSKVDITNAMNSIKGKKRVRKQGKKPSRPTPLTVEAKEESLDIVSVIKQVKELSRIVGGRVKLIELVNMI